MALTTVFTIGELTAHRTDHVFDSHTYVAHPSETIVTHDGETGQSTGNKQSPSTNDTRGIEHQVNVARNATTPRPQEGKSKARSVLKPVSSRISKQPLNQQRSLRHRIPRKHHEAENLGEKAGDSQKTRQEEPQDSNLTSTVTLPTHQVDPPGNLNGQPNSPDRQVQPRRASIALHPESVQRANRRRTRAPKSKLSTKINAESPTLIMILNRRGQNPTQKPRNSKQENRQRSPREFKTKSGRISKRPKRLGFKQPGKWRSRRPPPHGRRAPADIRLRVIREGRYLLGLQSPPSMPMLERGWAAKKGPLEDIHIDLLLCPRSFAKWHNTNLRSPHAR
ncbi:MAG: hypothetical protein Q9210_006575 [Variospora velana]